MLLVLDWNRIKIKSIVIFIFQGLEHGSSYLLDVLITEYSELGNCIGTCSSHQLL